MSCPEIEALAQDELDGATRAHVEGCPSCRERKVKLARLLAFPAMEAPPPDVLPRLLSKIEERIAQDVVRPRAQVARAPRPAPGRLVAAAVAFAVVGSSLLLVLTGDDTGPRERRLEALVSESEWRGLGYASEREFLADTQGGPR